MKIYKLTSLAFILTVFVSCDKTDPDPVQQNNDPEGYTLLWSDEFDAPAINTENWTYETGDGTAYGLPVGWGNNEKQIYTENEKNASIQSNEDLSVLAITAQKENDGSYTSAKLTTQNIFSMRFGRVDVKAKFPIGQGLLPAIWMLGTNKEEIGWPGCGEIDIAEILGHETSNLYSTVHFTNSENKHDETQGSNVLQGASFNDAYHVFTLDWTPEEMVFYRDDVLVTSISIDSDMKEFLRSAYLILNVAVGGNWPGEPDASTVFPQSLYVDYVRVYTKNGLEIPEAPVLDIEEESVGQVIEPNIADNAIKDGFSDLGNLDAIAYGGGGEPEILASEIAIDGEKSLAFNFPGGNWGGGYIQMIEAKNLDNYSYINFSLNYPEAFATAEIKLESKTSNAAIQLENYTGTAVTDGFVEFRIPLSDFAGLDLSQLTIPFSIWNPQDANQQFVKASILIDKLYFSN